MSSKHFVLICSPKETIKGDLQAHEVALYHLKNLTWPFYARTRNRAVISNDDKLLVYLSGSGMHSQSIIASCLAADSSVAGSVIYPKDWFVSSSSFYIKLKNVKLFKRPVKVKPLVEFLSFIKTKSNWGFRFQGGCISIPEHDFNILVKGKRPGHTAGHIPR